MNTKMSRSEHLFRLIVDGGEAQIRELITTRKSEELFLDFKRSSDNGAGDRLSQTDRNNLSRAISGFGNSEGGLVIWGVDCSPDTAGADVASEIVPLADAHRFASWLENSVSGATVPPHIGVRSEPIPVGDEPRGCVATHIPKSNFAPHQTIPRLSYYIRAGSSFVPTPHSVLAGMFGRRPQPFVFNNWGITPARSTGELIVCEPVLIIRNDGPGIARDIFINLGFLSKGGENCRIEFLPQGDRFSADVAYGVLLSMISNSDVRLPPQAQLQVLKIRVTLRPPFTEGIDISGSVGSAEGPPFSFSIRHSATELEGLCANYGPQMNAGRDGSGMEFVQALIGNADDETPV